MATLRNYNTLLNICHHSFRRRGSCWRLLVASRSELRGFEATAIHRGFSRSSVSSESTESTEDALPEEVAEMRSRMSKLHNILPSKGVTLADYKRSNNEEQNVSNSDVLNEDSEYDQFEDSPDQVKSFINRIEKGLRKQKDVDIVINMPYGHVRFDSMNRETSELQPVSEGNDVVEDEVPSVKIVKDGQHVFSVNAVEESKEGRELASEGILMDETCQASSNRLHELHDVKHSLFDGQYFGDTLEQREETQRNVASDTVNSEACDLKPNVFDEQYFGDVLQHEEQKQAIKQQEDDKQRNFQQYTTTTDGKMFDVKRSPFNEQYVGDVLQHQEQIETDFTHSKNAKKAAKKNKTCDVKPSVVQEQYFGDEKIESGQSTANDFVEYKSKQNKLAEGQNSGSHTNAAMVKNEKLSVIDDQYFGSYMQSKSASSQQTHEDNSGKEIFGGPEQMSRSQQSRSHSLAPNSRNQFEQHSTHMTLNESIITAGHNSAPVWKEVEDIVKASIPDDDNTVVVEPITHREMKARTRPRADVENPKTAYDLSMKIRLEQQQKQSTDKKEQKFGKNLYPPTVYVNI